MQEANTKLSFGRTISVTAEKLEVTLLTFVTK